MINKKRIYKKEETKLKRLYKQAEGNRLNILKKNNPRQFFAKFNKRSKSTPKVSLENFYEHFKHITQIEEIGDSNDANVSGECVFDELDKEICEDEIKSAISNLKQGKSHGEDGILNEYFIEFQEYLLPLLSKLFNCILDTGFFPKSWSSSVIVPIFKKGDNKNPDNYRGISLVSNMAKLFTSILNTRLLEWSKSNDIITDAQFGFKPNCGRREAIFVLHSLISNTISKSKRLYCAFIDFKKAFDSIDRSKLWIKLSKVGIQGKLLKVIKALYNNVKSCIVVEGQLSDYFCNTIGLMQGEVLSPILFNLYVNDFEMSFFLNLAVSLMI